MTPSRFVAAVVLVAVVVLAFGYWLHSKNHQQHHSTCWNYILEFRTKGWGLVNGSTAGQVVRSKPFTVVLCASPKKGWRFKYWLVNSSWYSQAPTLKLVVRGNTTVVAVFAEIPRYTLTVYIHGNGTVLGLYNTTVLEGERVVLVFRPAEGWALDGVFVNGEPVGNATRLDLCVRENCTVVVCFRRVYRYRLRVVSNVNATFWLNGAKYRVSATIGGDEPFTATIEGAWSVPFNATHSWWLAWYWVREGNRSWWWSYGLNGSRLTVRVRGNTTVELHYVLGLRKMPYVLSLRIFPDYYRDKVENCTLEWDENLGVIYRVLRGVPKDWGGGSDLSLLMEFPETYGVIRVRVEFPEPFDDYKSFGGRACVGMNSWMILLELKGQEFGGYMSFLIPSRGRVWDVYLYWDCYKLVQENLDRAQASGSISKYIKSHLEWYRSVYAKFEKMVMEKPILLVIDGKPVYYKGASCWNWERGLGKLAYPDFKRLVRLPNTGRQALIFYSLHTRKLIVARVLVTGVAPWVGG